MKIKADLLLSVPCIINPLVCRASSSSNSSAPTVDLGYATYQGYYNDTYDLNVWKRYVAYIAVFKSDGDQIVSDMQHLP